MLVSHYCLLLVIFQCQRNNFAFIIISSFSDLIWLDLVGLWVASFVILLISAIKMVVVVILLRVLGVDVGG